MEYNNYCVLKYIFKVMDFCAEGAYFDPVKVEVQPKVLLNPLAPASVCTIVHTITGTRGDRGHVISARSGPAESD